MYKEKIKFITRTAVLLALTLVFQYLGRYIPLGPNSNFIVGPLVNACLIISTFFIGVTGGAVIAILSVLGAILTGAALPLPLVPFIILGNLALILAFHFIKGKILLKVVIGAVSKFIVIFVAASLIIPAVIPVEKVQTTMLFVFGWPQLVTAFVGGIIAIVVINRLKTVIKE